MSISSDEDDKDSFKKATLLKCTTALCKTVSFPVNGDIKILPLAAVKSCRECAERRQSISCLSPTAQS